MKYRKRHGKFLAATTAQVAIFEKRQNSRIEKEYSLIMRRAATALAEYARDATFEELIQAEQTLQNNDLAVYAKRPATIKSVQEGIDDINDGMDVCKQLLEDTEAYKSHKYRHKERIPPEHIIPLDAMRRALRGQVKRVENYRVNVMGNDSEQDFLTARIELLHRAEEIYDSMQRERLLPEETSQEDLEKQ